MGVEEEFLLVDPRSGAPVPKAVAVLAAARTAGETAGHGAGRPVLHPELLATQVEAASPVCTSLTELEAAVREGRRVLADAAHAEGALLVSSGTPPLPGPRPGLTEGPRFDDIHRHYAGAVEDYQSCGCHVHVGVPDRSTAVAVVNQLRPWLPTLLALSANSPLHDGADTGYASWRIMMQARFPGSGVPPHFPGVAAHDAAVARRVATGVSVDPGMTPWFARPSPRFPTVEVRAADAGLTVADTLLQAALTRALVATALRDVAAGVPAPLLTDDVAAAAVFNAARHGVSGPAVDPGGACLVPVDRLVDALLDHVGDALSARGEAATVRALLDELVAEGDGASRQRAAWRAGPDRLLSVVGCAPTPRA